MARKRNLHWAAPLNVSLTEMLFVEILVLCDDLEGSKIRNTGVYSTYNFHCLLPIFILLGHM